MAVIEGRSAPGKHDFVCEVPRCGFVSLAWDTKENASSRGVQHQLEHDTGEAMPELKDFEAMVGFERTEETAALAADLEAGLKQNRGA